MNMEAASALIFDQIVVEALGMIGIQSVEQSLPPYGEPASRQLLTHLPRHGSPYGSPPVKRDVRARR